MGNIVTAASKDGPNNQTNRSQCIRKQVKSQGLLHLTFCLSVSDIKSIFFMYVPENTNFVRWFVKKTFLRDLHEGSPLGPPFLPFCSIKYEEEAETPPGEADSLPP